MLAICHVLRIKRKLWLFFFLEFIKHSGHKKKKKLEPHLCRSCYILGVNKYYSLFKLHIGKHVLKHFTYNSIVLHPIFIKLQSSWNHDLFEVRRGMQAENSDSSFINIPVDENLCSVVSIYWYFYYRWNNEGSKNLFIMITNKSMCSARHSHQHESVFLVTRAMELFVDCPAVSP